MSHCVPDLDVGSSELDYLHSPRLARGKREAVVASLPPMCDKGEEKYLRDKKKAVDCVTASRISRMESEAEEKHAHAFDVGRASALAVDVPLGHLPFQEDEMLSWLQYPLDDTFSKSYCSEQLCEQPFTLYPAQSSILGSISLDSEKLSSTSLSSQLLEPSDSSVGIEMLTSDAAMAMGAHRAAGLLPQAGAEAFNTLHTTRQLSDNASSSKASDIHNAEDNHASKQTARNFSFFSQRVAAMKTSLQILGTSSGPSNKERLKQPFNTDAHKKSSSLEQCAGTSASLTSLSPRGESCLSEQGREAMQTSDTHAGQKFMDPSHHLDEAGKAKTEVNARSAAAGLEAMETGDVTAVTSLSDGSDYSTEKSGKEVADLSCKRKPCPAEDFECDSKDARKVASQEKGRPTLDGSNSSKRIRAAEVHNQSERRRRNKINEKMRALQKLIPNANKTDKASMLDEAIEYLKMLQAQLQWMSARTGIMVPPVMMPPGMEYLAVPQRQGPSQVNTGMGVSRGVAMDDSNSGSGSLSWRPPFPGQPLPGHAYHLTGYPPNASPSVLHEVPSSMNPIHWHPTFAFQQPQPSHSPRTSSIYKAHMQAKSADSRKQL